MIQNAAERNNSLRSAGCADARCSRAAAASEYTAVCILYGVKKNVSSPRTWNQPVLSVYASANRKRSDNGLDKEQKNARLDHHKESGSQKRSVNNLVAMAGIGTYNEALTR